MTQYKLFRCRVSFGSYRAKVAADSSRDAEDLVHDDRSGQIERAAEGDDLAQRHLSHDLQPVAACEEVEEGDYTRGRNVDDGFVYGRIHR